MTNKRKLKAKVIELDKKRKKLLKEMQKIESQIRKLDDVIAKNKEKCWPLHTGIRHIQPIFKRSINFSGWEE